MLLALVPLFLIAPEEPPEVPWNRHHYSVQALELKARLRPHQEVEDCSVASTLSDRLARISFGEMNVHVESAAIVSTMDPIWLQATEAGWTRREFRGSVRRFDAVLIRVERSEEQGAVYRGLDRGDHALFREGTEELVFSECSPPLSFGRIEDLFDQLRRGAQATDPQGERIGRTDQDGAEGSTEIWRHAQEYVSGQSQHESVLGRRLNTASWTHIEGHAYFLTTAVFEQSQLGPLYPKTIIQISIEGPLLEVLRYDLNLESLPSSAQDIAFPIPKGTRLAPTIGAPVSESVDLLDRETWPAHIRRMLK